MGNCFDESYLTLMSSKLSAFCYIHNIQRGLPETLQNTIKMYTSTKSIINTSIMNDNGF